MDSLEATVWLCDVVLCWLFYFLCLAIRRKCGILENFLWRIKMTKEAPKIFITSDR